eukprot:CAMPEP_0114559904 /NCGR_PEP_ID=MMETSP0114-20121206/11171_1 /TAXON_ID=31324 /ORGANISM="Goniomonas sp, Strain m" /LENGTH=407 /DNA_ID=CAMNT_0001745407 /DNA_START=8 /DNA_END=1231 /DNA_ORIENTATION=-
MAGKQLLFLLAFAFLASWTLGMDSCCQCPFSAPCTVLADADCTGRTGCEVANSTLCASGDAAEQCDWDKKLSTAVGLISICCTVVLWGTFFVFLKDEKVVKANLHPFVFQLYMNLGIALISGWAIILDTSNWEFTPWGICSGFIWVPANIFAISACKHLGMAVAQSTWSGGVIICSFLWGWLYFHETPHNLPMTFVGLAGLIISICGIASSNEPPKEDPDATRLLDDDLTTSTPNLQHPSSDYKKEAPPRSVVKGLLCCLMVAVLAGSTNAPLMMVPAGQRGPGFAANFAIGILLTCICCFIGAHIQARVATQRPPQWHLRDTMLPCLLSGIMWGAGNIGSITVTLSTLGLSIGFPLTQSALLVAGLWGILYYKEVHSKMRIVRFFVSALLLLASAVVLALYGAAAN